MCLILRVQVLIITAFCAHLPCFSQSPYLLDETSVAHRLDRHVRFFVDSSESLSLTDVLSPATAGKFVLHEGSLRFGYLKYPIWIQLKTRRHSPHSQWYLEIPAPFLEYVDFYQWRDSGHWRHTVSGYFRKQSERAFSHTGHVLPLRFGNDSLSTVYLRIGGVSPKTFPLYVIEKEAFTRKMRLEDLGYGVFFGILSVMFVYNLFIFVTSRQRNYLLYVGIIGCTFLIFAAISGYGGKFIWPEKPELNYWFGKLTLEVLIVFVTLYTIHFLQVKKYSRLLYLMLCALIPLSVIALLLASFHSSSYAGNNLIAIASVLYIASGFVVSAKGNKTARYFVAAWSIYFSGALLLSLRNRGVLDYNFWTTHFVEVGAVLGTTVVGLALGAQYRKFESEKEDAQKRALSVQREATAKMELEVLDRTAALYKANKELERTLETNRKQTDIIAGKNAELDTFFYRVSHDLKGPIASSLALMTLAKRDVRDDVALGYIERQCLLLERLNLIIHGLIDVTKLNDPNLVRESIDFERLIDDCITSFTTLQNFPAIRFEKEIQADLGFYSEWNLLNAIVQNLIENAIKYARPPDAYVKISVYKETEWLAIRIEDNGMGIPADQQSRIFEMFYRATNASNGSGLGLYILQRSLDRLNGIVEIESEPDKGTTFVVRLPLVTAPEQAAADEGA